MSFLDPIIKQMKEDRVHTCYSKQKDVMLMFTRGSSKNKTIVNAYYIKETYGGYKKGTITNYDEFLCIEVMTKDIHIQPDDGKTIELFKVIRELTHKDTECDSVLMNFETKIVESVPNNLDWLEYELRKELTEKHIKLSLTKITFNNNEKIHHNSKPAVIYVRNNNIYRVNHYRHNEQCISTCYRAPSNIFVDHNVLLQLFISETYTRDQKRTTKMITHLAKHSREVSWFWNNKEIPEEMMYMLEWPLDDAMVFTLEMAV